MTVIDIHGANDFADKIESGRGKLVVVDFTASWCGPCQHIKPHFHEMSNEFPNVVFLQVDEGSNKDVVQAAGIRAFPTFQFFMDFKKVDEMKGASVDGLRGKIESWSKKVFNPFANGAGNKLGSNASGGSAASAAAARALKNANSNVCSMDNKAACVMGSNDVALESGSAPKVEESNVNGGILEMMLDMGFPDVRARKAILATNNSGVEQATAWLEEHQDDEDIDDEMKVVQKKELTPEEKAAKLEELQLKIQQKKIQREEEAKVNEKKSELQRREMGQQMNDAREEYAKIQRQANYEKIKREKDDAKRERERLRAEIAKDKAERMARGGRLSGGIRDPVQVESSPAPVMKKQQLTKEQTIDNCVNVLSKQRTGGDGQIAMKTLGIYLKNLIEKPDEAKFRTINLQNPAFKKRVSHCIGGVSFLKAIGYEKQDDDTLYLDIDHRDKTLLQYAQSQLTKKVGP